MIHALLIVLLALIAAHDSLPGLPVMTGLEPRAVALWSLGTMALVPPVLHLFTLWCARRLDRTGAHLYIALAEGAAASARLVAVLFQAVNVLVLGWLEAVRSALGGDLVLVDEALATAPPIAVFFLSFVSWQAIESRLRVAALMRSLDDGGALPDFPSRWSAAWDRTRVTMLVILVPVGVIAAWAEGVDALLPAAAEAAGWPPGSIAARAAAGGLHIAGLAGVLLLMPLALRRIWSTEPLGPGPMRERLLGLCRAQGVACRDILVWRTHGNMLNGAVIGFLPPLRYILLTDTLLERLPPEQVEAVMAHEVAHARRRHIPWLMLAILVAVSLCWTVVSMLAERLAPPGAAPGPIGHAASFLASIVAAILVFGWISRRFEEQADAFAVQHLSGMTRREGRGRGIVLSAEAAEAMAGALMAVARQNFIPPERFTWRHGSIASRCRRLLALPGLPAHALPIDRLVGRIKAASVAGLVLLVALSFLPV